MARFMARLFAAFQFAHAVLGLCRGLAFVVGLGHFEFQVA
jgi:hypothetical protein